MRGSVFEGLFYIGKSSVARFLSVIEGFPSLRSSVFEGFHCIIMSDSGVIRLMVP